MKPWKWETINKIGKTKIAKSTFVFLFVVPVLARFIVESQYADIFDVALPFSWVVLYFSAICVALSTALYFIFCPDLVKQYREFNSFQAGGRGLSFLKSELGDCLRISSRTKGLRELVDAAYEQYPDEIYHRVDTSTLNQDEQRPSPVLMQVIFWVCHDVANSTHRMIRVVAEASYILGFFLFTLVLGQNLIYVLKYIFSSS